MDGGWKRHSLCGGERAAPACKSDNRQSREGVDLALVGGSSRWTATSSHYRGSNVFLSATVRVHQILSKTRSAERHPVSWVPGSFRTFLVAPQPELRVHMDKVRHQIKSRPETEMPPRDRRRSADRKPHRRCSLLRNLKLAWHRSRRPIRCGLRRAGGHRRRLYRGSRQ